MSNSDKHSNVSRRGFLKAIGLALGAPTFASIVGCHDQEQPSSTINTPVKQELYLNIRQTENAVFAETNGKLEQFIVFAEQEQIVPREINHSGELISIQIGYDLYIENRARTIRSSLSKLPNYKKVIDEIIDECIPKQDRKATLEIIKDVVSALSSVEETKEIVLEQGLENAFREFRELDSVRYLRQFGISILRDIAEKASSLKEIDDKELVKIYDYMNTYLEPTIELLKSLKGKKTIQEKMNDASSDLTLNSLDEFSDAAIEMGEAAVSQGKNEPSEEERKFIEEVKKRFENTSKYLKQKISKFKIAYLGEPNRVFIENGNAIAYAAASSENKRLEDMIIVKNIDTGLEGKIILTELHNKKDIVIKVIDLNNYKIITYQLDDLNIIGHNGLKGINSIKINKKYIAWINNDEEITILDMHNGSKKKISYIGDLKRKYRTDGNRREMIGWTADDKLLFVDMTEHDTPTKIIRTYSLKLWNPKTGEYEIKRDRYDENHDILDIPIMSSDCKKVIIEKTTGYSNEMIILNLETKIEIRHQSNSGKITGMEWSLDSEKTKTAFKGGILKRRWIYENALVASWINEEVMIDFENAYTEDRTGLTYLDASTLIIHRTPSKEEIKNGKRYIIAYVKQPSVGFSFLNIRGIKDESNIIHGKEIFETNSELIGWLSQHQLIFIKDKENKYTINVFDMRDNTTKEIYRSKEDENILNLDVIQN